ncbi:MAG: ABC transporter ATP-binding protein [Nitrososphaeria archaeon]
MAELVIENISKKFMGKTALDNVSLTIHDKLFTTIFGNAGAGKTTLLRIIAGVEKPDKGKIYLNGKDITTFLPKDRNVAMVYQSFALYPHMTVYDNIANPLRARKMTKSQIDEKVNQISKSLGIQELLSRYPRELSGGQAQRVAIARSLVRDADVYLLDEPLTNLDYKIREGMREELKKMCKDFSATLVYASPDPLDALAMADRVAVMSDGKLLQYGLTRDVYYTPNDITVATIFGTPPINILKAEAREKDGHLFLETPLFRTDVTKYKERLSPNKEYKVGVRPHHLAISKRKVEVEMVSFPAEVHLTHVVGAETICYARSNSEEITIHVPYIYRMEGLEQVYVYFDPAHLLVFDKDTGLRVT